MLNALKLTAGCDDGQTTIEYLLVLVLIVLVIVLAVQVGLLTSAISVTVNTIGSALT